MAPPANSGTGGRENNPWMQPANGLGDLEDDTDIFTNRYMMQPANGLIDPEDNFNINDIPTNIYAIQAAAERAGTPRTSSNHINILVANRSDYQGYTGANIPRGDVSMEQIRALFTQPFRRVDSDIVPQHSRGNMFPVEKVQDEPEYITHARAPHVTKRSRKNSGHSSQEWEKWKPEIYRVYVDGNCTLKVTRAEMARKGFHAEEYMYKSRIKDWGWRTYELGKDDGNPGGEPFIGKARKRARGKVLGAPSTLRQVNSQSSSSRSTTVAAFTPPYFTNTHFNPIHSNPAHFNPAHFNPAHFNPAYFNMRIPAPMSKTDISGPMTTILAELKHLYISYPDQEKWKVQKEREVEEDIHDDLLVGVATSLRNYSSLSPDIGYMGFQQALHTLEKVVGVGEGADCGPFSLPAIWESFLRMIREERSDWAREFLLRASQLAIFRFGNKHPFVQVLVSLQKIPITEPDQLAKAIFGAYRSCIAHMKVKLGPLNLTYLSLWGDYVVYLDGTATGETQEVVNNIRSVIKIIEEEKGPDGGLDGDYTLELLGLTLFVLQSAPTMADEAEKVAQDLLRRVDQRRVKAGGKLEGDLFITWKDLSQTLGTLCQNKEDYRRAVEYLKDFLNHEIVDDRDTLALEKLEKCYTLLGRVDDAKTVWQWRMDSSKRLLQKTSIEPGGEEVVDDHGERDDNDGSIVSEEEGSSEATVVGELEGSNEENLEEDDIDEAGDAEVEIQLVQEQMAELKQRLSFLKGRRL